MRLLQLRVGSDRIDDVLAALRDEDIDPLVSPLDDTAGKTMHLVQFPLPTEAIDRIRESLSDAGFDEEYVIISNAETAKTPNYERLVERYVEQGEESERVSHEEIRTKAHGLHPQPQTYYGMTILSSLVATAGLLLDSPALVVGSMVIAPQVGAALTGSVGAAIGDQTMFSNGLRSTLIGLTVAIIAAAALGWGLKTAQFVPAALNVSTVQQVANRTSPGLLTLIVALCAGSAGAFGLATELPVSIVGVAVAAATVPAAAAVGIGIAWLIPAVAVGAFTLLAVNIAGIIFAGAATFWYLGYRPSFWTTDTPLRRRLRLAVTSQTVWVGLLFLGVTVLGPGVLLTSHIAFENQAIGAVQGTLDKPVYSELELISIRVTFETVGLREGPQEVAVTVRRQTNTQYPALASQLSEQISSETNRDVEVIVSFEDSQKAVTSESA
ncbi:TIGR00341 family protein [Haloferax sp. S1W]|uniref:TIGR00341 family protein n=1 Tax=Haloferax sp. S1W TaxID=3377110 RepID=UPI0037C884ED